MLHTDPAPWAGFFTGRPLRIGVRLLDLSQDPSLPHLTAMLRDLTRAQDTTSAYNAFVSRYVKLRPVGYYLGVLPDPDEPGAFRVLYSQPAGTPFTKSLEDTARVPELPVHRGGFVGAMIADEHPKYAMDLSLADDPLLGGLVADMRTCMVLPIFEGDRVVKWTFGFCREHTVEDAREVGEAAVVTNMLGILGKQLLAVNTVKELNLRLRDQLDQIARVQQSLLPSRTPNIPGLEVATSYLTSDESGGDYYDFLPLGGGRWGLLIADVSGHGAAAATIMAMLHAILHCYAPAKGSGDIDPAAVLEFANDRLLAAGLEGNFITAFFGVLDPATGVLRYSNAGHNPPRVKDGQSGRILPIEDAATVPLGILESLEAEVREVQLKAGDTLVLYTDGITEAFSPAGQQFEVKGLDASLIECSGAPDCVVESIHKALFAHRGSATRDDDQTIVAMRYHGLCAL